MFVIHVCGNDRGDLHLWLGPICTIVTIYIGYLVPSLDKAVFENVQRFANHMATSVCDSSYHNLLDLDLPTLDHHRLETRFASSIRDYLQSVLFCFTL